MLPERNDALLEFYSQPGMMTEIGPHLDLLEGLPQDIPGLCRVVQGTLLHIFWAQAYGVTLSEGQKETVNVRSVVDKLARLRAVDPRPLSQTRPLELRQVGNCRDFSVLLCALLRFQGRPARARCGFGAYFLPGKYEDHWVCEYWRADQRRWVMVDAQLDELQQQKLHISFDPCDVPDDQFIVAGKAWLMCRSGKARPDDFGIFDMHGWWFIAGNVLREFLSYNKIEILPWDGGLPLFDRLKPEAQPEDIGAELLDRLAALTVAGDAGVPELHRLLAEEPLLHPEGFLIA